MNGLLELGRLADERATVQRLLAGGLKAPSAAPKAELFARSARRLLGLGVESSARVHAFFVPGRIEVLGKHTDYAGGRSVVVAADRGFCVVAAAREDPTVRMVDAAWDQQAAFEIDPELAPAIGHWSNYPMTVARRLARNFPGPLRGTDAAFGSDLPASSWTRSTTSVTPANTAPTSTAPNPWEAISAPSRTAKASARSRVTGVSGPSAAAKTTPPSSAGGRIR